MNETVDVGQHYDNARVVYRKVGRLDGALSPGNADKNKWYINDPGASGKWDGRGRPCALSPDIDDFDIERVVYMTVNYAPADYYMNAWQRYRWTDDGREWDGGNNPMPDYADLTAIAPFADVDLLDGVKARRPDGEIPTDMIERALDGYIEGFAELCGGRGPVHALDSVGGAYVMVAPSVTQPITERFSGDDRAVLLQELADKLNDHLTDVRDRVAERVEGHDDVLDPDMINHKNRLHKAPLSLHASLDGVVTPIDTDTPEYEFTHVESVGDAEISGGVEWAESYTGDYRDRVGELVAELWGGEPEAWQDTLQAWLDEQEPDESPEVDANPGGDGGEIPSGRRTAPLKEVYRALDNLDAEDVAEDTIVHDWNDSATSGNGKGFYPTWGPNSNGTANYVNPDKGIWHDTGAGHHGTVIEMALIGDGSWSRGEIAQGKDWVRGIRELRSLGYDVPLPAGDVDNDMSKYYALDLSGIAADHDIDGDPYRDNSALLKACLLAREETPGVNGEKPPYGAVVAVAERIGLDFDDPEESILGESTYDVARRVFDDLEPGDV